jgi:hypothetical protein
MLCHWLKVNLGEPPLPIQLARRGKASIVHVDFDLIAGDHDFSHVVNLTPSVVTLLTEVKTNLDDNWGSPSLYKGEHEIKHAISFGFVNSCILAIMIKYVNHH